MTTPRRSVTPSFTPSLNLFTKPFHHRLSSSSRTFSFLFRTMFTDHWPDVPVYIFSSISGSVPSVLWHCQLGTTKSIWHVKIEWRGVGVVICMKRRVDCLHIVQLHPQNHNLLPHLNPDWFYLSGAGLHRWSWKRPLNGRSSSSSSSSSSGSMEWLLWLTVSFWWHADK